MDLQLVERENRLIGQEFLTWLWFYSETTGGTFQTKDGRGFSINLEQRISVQGGEGENLATATVSSPLGELTEALSGLRIGKKVNKAQLRMERDGETWMISVKAEDFGFSGLKTPKIETKSNDDEDPDGAFLEKMYLIEECLEMLDASFARFLKLRLGPDWKDESAGLTRWVTGG
ncbi:hypothetical protein SAMN02745704_01263 [Paucidesulfovibrio gracilis DSM 16080]|uniref:Uncharacterized protein n=1 Tax=Paucidesulfovibrio gracilis DSM 16080 TaxID=1121449 RepID=A0A1T4WT68_9BACT|nr:hypothetical protein [Paucidesulfovibrio gracilis]SKA79791.1 hypothetical protein SAMN02745704_01263 [Paucidesulfovibrio gracilis DSM 16080]